MLRAALIGFGSSGKSTLFQLMTSAKDTARTAQGKEAAIGISKVPDARLDRMTEMFNPKKRIAATVEFSDLAAQGHAGGAQALVDVVAYKNADALVHVLRDQQIEFAGQLWQDPCVAQSIISRLNFKTCTCRRDPEESDQSSSQVFWRRKRLALRVQKEFVRERLNAALA